MNTRKLIVATGTSALSFLGFTSTAFAQAISPCQGGFQFASLCNITQAKLPNVISTAVTVILVIAVLIALFFLILGGIRWITSGGDKAKVESARNTIIAAIIGLVVAFLAFFILSVVLKIFGLSLDTLTIPTI